MKIILNISKNIRNLIVISVENDIKIEKYDKNDLILMKKEENDEELVQKIKELERKNTNLSKELQDLQKMFDEINEINIEMLRK